MIRLIQFDDLSLFKKEVIPFLEQAEAENNLVLGVLQALTEEAKIYYMAVVYKGASIGLVLLQTQPHQIILSRYVQLTSEDIRSVGESLHRSLPDIPGFIGEKQATSELAASITHFRGGIPAAVFMNQRIYKLETLKRKPLSPGRLRTIAAKDLPTIREWVYQFCIETNQAMSEQEAAKRTALLIQKGLLAGWEVDGKLVSMANGTRPTRTNVTISYVYTPVSERKKGYAADCVAALTQQMLDNGYKSTSLYTDLSNPTSNKIYMEIGYEPVMDSVVLLFQ
ncbi:GNAT family N-acetyltransferase [Paenibacillus aestuarii]|uniref:GNAT family N-acetyltransferase n=1 Tax=Paenibacillus aestuarii TaxID=516965 RepID=A0ABW0K7G2_9BACL|nr:GNAT family N-acetyltransferase [Paenibacillus aestuarii]